MNQPSMEQWRLFVQIADLGSLSLTATVRDVAQPALSRQLAALEKACGGRLFERGARGVRLNEVGQRLYPQIVEWLARADELLLEARGESRIASGQVRFGVLASISPQLVTEVFKTVREKFPRIQLQISSGLSGMLAEGIGNGTLDLALLSTNTRDYRSQEIPIGSVPHVLVGAPGDVITRAKTVTFSQLDNLPLLVPGGRYALHGLLLHWAHRKKISLNVVAECDALDLQKQLIRTAGVYAIMAISAVRSDVEKGFLQAAEIVSPALQRNLVLRVSSAKPLTPACREVLRIVEQSAIGLLKADAKPAVRSKR
ncbi:LysR family transcriptional regulator [Advenella incenata]|nr:LysR family transcriptional regulator [Advenella incenata]